MGSLTKLRPVAAWSRNLPDAVRRFELAAPKGVTFAVVARAPGLGDTIFVGTNIESLPALAALLASAERQAQARARRWEAASHPSRLRRFMRWLRRAVRRG